MTKQRQNKRLCIALAVCLIIGLLQAASLLAFAGYFRTEGVDLLLTITLLALLGAILGALFWFMPYAFIVLGRAKLRDQKMEELEALGNENEVYADPDGERKLHDYLTAVTSLEARIGLVQRSATYVPPENRAPEGATRAKSRLSKRGWNIIKLVLIFGTVGGVVAGRLHGLGAAGPAGVGTLKLFMSGMVGALLISPLGVVLAMLFGRIEDVEENDDSGAGGPETA